ncbi:hypothetical protein WJX72_002224 [[Myrmecia] bisecta]|uniref:Uncharacterized protein n=1 Tax=[Myrmecia] bisecta TaxID=41462 RepID=A0AAW1P5P2_9CHLO
MNIQGFLGKPVAFPSMCYSGQPALGLLDCVRKNSGILCMQASANTQTCKLYVQPSGQIGSTDTVDALPGPLE